MTIFVVFRVSNPELMKSAITDVYPNDHFELGQSEWLVSDTGTAKNVSDKIGITPGGDKSGTAIVFSMANYYGRAASNIWEWVKLKAEATDG